MTSAELAVARHRLYALLGRLWVEGPRGEALDLARAVAGLAEALADDDEALAAGHHAATTDVPCVASAHLGEDGLVGGEVADQVAASYAEAGFSPRRRDVPVDHLGLQLACLGHLCAAEAEALADGVDAAPIRALAGRVLDEHLLRWLPAWSVAVAAAEEPAWGTVAELTLELAASHRSGLGGQPAPFALNGAPVALDAALGLDEVSAMLVRPARSGWLLGRTPLLRACAAAGVASGLGERARMLEAAVRGAAAVGRLEALMDALRASVVRADVALAAAAVAWPILEVPVAPWRSRLEVTREALETLKRSA